MRSVKRIMHAETLDMDGVVVKQALPTIRIEQIDPFLLLHHLTLSFPGDSHQKLEGIGPHPHRGFSPVTFIFQGSVHHRDSRGNNQVIEAGGVQWLDAGMGIIHSERPSRQLSEEGGLQEMIQVWINTKKSHKMNQPVYQPFQSDQIPTLSADQGDGNLSLVTGELNGKKGPVKSPLDLVAVMGNFKSRASSKVYIPQNMNALVYLLGGEMRIEGHGLVEQLNLVYFNNDSDHIQLKATQNSRFLLLAGVPINEPLAQHGPYVMNNQTEILEAMRDYQMGKMGILIEEFE